MLSLQHPVKASAATETLLAPGDDHTRLVLACGARRTLSSFLISFLHVFKIQEKIQENLGQGGALGNVGTYGLVSVATASGEVKKLQLHSLSAIPPARHVTQPGSKLRETDALGRGRCGK